MCNSRPCGPEPRPYRIEISQRLPRLAFPMDNPPTVEGVELGRRLFADPRLSKNNTQSCASCHQQAHAFSDPRRTSPGAEGQPGRRNAMPLFNLAWGQSFFWDGRAATLREQALVPIQDAHEMNETLDRVVGKLQADADVSGLVQDARSAAMASAPSDSPSRSSSSSSRSSRRIRSSTAPRAELATLTPPGGTRTGSLFHGARSETRPPRRRLLPLPRRRPVHHGLFANNGLEPLGDAGRFEVTKREDDRGKFKTPSLRNVALTAPYMHDGRFATLEEVIDHYDHGIHPSPTLDPNIAKHPPTGLGLSAEDKQALVAFLKTLSDESFVGRERR